MTENDEPLSAVLAHILEAVFADCETRSDWLTHILDPGVRAAAARLAEAMASAIGC